MAQQQADVRTAALRLVEALPYPRGAVRGRHVDADGTPLHGAYEHRTRDGRRVRVFNNGVAQFRYAPPRGVEAFPLTRRHNWANVVLLGWGWAVGDDAERPVTQYPRSEYPHAVTRTLYEQHAVLERVAAGRKPLGDLVVPEPELEVWLAQAQERGLDVGEVARRGAGQHRSVELLVGRPGPLADRRELAALIAFYSAHLPPVLVHLAVDMAARCSVRHPPPYELTSPRSPVQFLVTGYLFGYPPESTLALLLGGVS